MASTKKYLDFVLDCLSSLDGITHRKMMGEYILYHDGKVVGGVYDDRLLLKPTKTALSILAELSVPVQTDIPYDGAKEMLAIAPEERDLVCRLVVAVSSDLAQPKKNK